MVWRGDIKVLGLKVKILSLVISMSLHVIMLFVLSIVSHEREKVFTVELVVQDFTSNIWSRPKYTRRGAGDIHVKRRNPSDADSKKGDITPAISGHESASLKSEAGIHASRKQDSQSTTDIENDRMGIFSDEQGGGGLIAEVNGSRRDIIEGEFGSINGPSFLKMVKPEYPHLARRLGKEGKVVLRLFIDEHGRLVNVEIIEKAGHGFDEAAIDAAKASSFQPAKLNGHPVACKAVLPIRFRLE